MIRRFFLLISLLSLCWLATPLTASAAGYNPFGHVDCSGASQSAVCHDSPSGQCAQNDNSCNPVTKTITNVTHILAVAAGIAAVIMLIVGGLKYTTSNGDSNAISSAKNTIINALVGLVIIVISQSLIVFVIDRIN